MKILAITGPFGSGKTTVTHLVTAALRSAGIAVRIIALDELSRFAVDNDLALRHELADTFGMHILNDDSSLNRPALAELAFADDQSTAKLNALVHPPTIQLALEQIKQAQAAGELPVVELPFPVMYFSEVFTHDTAETTVWTVSADKETRLERGLADGFKLEDVLARMDRQPRNSAYLTESDLTIENSDSLADLRLEVQMCIEQSGLASDLANV